MNLIETNHQQHVEEDHQENLRESDNDPEASASQKEFCIQHILEEIMRCVELQGLYNCRLVCHSWNSTVAFLIQKQFTLYLRGYWTFIGYRPSRKLLATRPLQNRSTFTPYNKNAGPGELKPSKELDELVQLLETSKQLKLAHCFPCRKFQFVDTSQGSSMKNLHDPALQRFLDTFGMYLDELSICFDSRVTIEDDPDVLSYVLHEQEAMKLIENLLAVQAPSLSFLSLEFPTHVAWEVDGESRGKFSSLRTTDPEFQKIRQHLEGKRKSKLKFLHWTKQVSAKVVEVILQLAPQLRSIVLQTGYEHLLTEPLDGLHLLRSVDINPRYGSIQSLENLASASRPGNLFLKNMYIRFCHCDICVDWGIWTLELQWRMIHVINAIFSATHSPSLKSIDWFGKCDGVRTHINFKNVAPTICKFGERDPLYPVDINDGSPHEGPQIKIHM